MTTLLTNTPSWFPHMVVSYRRVLSSALAWKGQRGLSDLYISSYTPTLSVLIRAQQLGSPVAVNDGPRIIAIGEANAVGESELFSVSSELETVGQCVDGLATFTRIEGPDSCMSCVAEELRQTQWVHLACHGVPNRKRPFESVFALHDGRITIKRIIRCDLDSRISLHAIRLLEMRRVQTRSFISQRRCSFLASVP
ncbi:hypothetical protein V8E55_008346 [Tylopilus felleus]